MSNIKIVKEVVEGVLSGASDIIEALPSNEKKQSAKNQLAGLTYNALNTALDSQEEVLKAELGGNWLQKSWRPLIMLGFGFIVMYSKFIAPAFGLPNTELNGEFWELLNLGIGGYVIGRSVEKVSDTVTKNIDVSFLKKKNRKL